MGATKIIDIATLKETENFGGSSLPVVENGEYKKVDLAKYETRVKEQAAAATAEQNRIDAGQHAVFDGFTDVVPTEQTSASPENETNVLYSSIRRAFCFEHNGSVTVAHRTLSAVYNDTGGARKDKTYLFGDRLYVAGGPTGLRQVHGVELSDTEGESTEKAVSEKGMTTALRARDSRITAAEESVTAETAERKQADTQIKTSVTNAENAVTALSGRVDTELTTVKESITAESEARTAADTALGKRVDGVHTEITEEQTRATRAETAERDARIAADNELTGETARLEREAGIIRQDVTTIGGRVTSEEEKSSRIEREYKAADAEITAGMAAMEERLDEYMYGTANHMAAAWDGTTNERAVAEAGDKSILSFDMMLIDHKDNAHDAVAPKLLKNNNILRFRDGSFAPAVVITPEMKAQTDGDVYRKVNGQLQKYCNAGEYNAEEFYKTYGVREKLYDAGGTEIHALMPWETTSTDYSVMTGCLKSVHYIDNALGKSGKIWKSISLAPSAWDGIQSVELLPTAINPSGVYCIEEGGVMKTRCMFALKEGLDKGYVHSSGHAGAGNVCSLFAGGRTYPTTNGINQVRNMEWARNNNADPTSTLPWAEGGFAYRDMFVTWLEIMYGRKDISNANFFGNGIATVYGMNYETWMNEGGVRYKGEGDADWEYQSWSSKPADLCYNAEGKQTSWSDMLNYQYAKEQCMESQLAASWAVENNIPEGVHFMMYGCEYWWKNVPGAMGLNDGRMNVKVYKLVKGEINAYTKLGVQKTVSAEIVLRMSLYEGVKLAGDVYQYAGGGYEVVGETLPTSTSGGYGEPVDIYLQPDQSKWHSESSTSKSAKGAFDFEKTYPCIGHDTTKGGYVLQTIPFSNFPLTLGGGLTKGDCYYFYNSNYWGYSTPGDRVRIGQRFGGYAASVHCAPRLANCLYTAGYTFVTYGGSAQVRLLQGIADA